MNVFKYIMISLALLGAALGLASGITQYEGGGLAVILCLVPAALGLASNLASTLIARVAAGLSIPCFLLVSMLGSKHDALEGVMIAAFFGMVFAVIVMLRAERPAKAARRSPARA